MTTRCPPTIAIRNIAAAAIAGTLLAGCASDELRDRAGPRESLASRPPKPACDATAFDTPPVYTRGKAPDILRNANKDTVITVHFIVEPDGSTSHISAETTGDWRMAGFGGLAVQDWEFRPARKGDAAVAASCTVKFAVRFD